MWKIFKYEGQDTNYEISDYGQVRNKKTKKILKLQTSKDNYKTVVLSINKKPKNMRVHRLVAMTYIENPLNKPVVNHKDGNRQNNTVSNLEWVTSQENTIHAVNTGLMPRTKEKQVDQFDMDGNKIATYRSLNEAERQTGTPASKISDCCNLKRNSSNLFQWRFHSDEYTRLPKSDIPVTTRKRVARCDKDGNILQIYDSLGQAAKDVHGTQSAITHVLKGDKQTVTHKGYYWKLVEEIVQQS